MRITALELDGYIPFSFNHIRKFKMDMNSPIQIIIGTNGCGKSSLVRECNPRPAVSTSFQKGGKKRLEIQHKTNDFVVTSDFGNSSSPHSFIMNNVELNISGTTRVQEELIAEHLGYTNTVHNLINGNIAFTDMTQSLRKAFLVEINPYNISYVVDLNKKIASRIRDITGTIKQLNKRKAELQPNILDDETLLQITNSKIELNEDLETIDRWIYSVEPHIARLRQLENNFHINSNMESLVLQVLDIEKQVSEFDSLPRDEIVLDRELDRHISIISGLQTSLDRIFTDSATLAQDLDKYEKLLETQKDQYNEDNLVNKIEDARKQLDQIGHRTKDPVSQNVIDDWIIYGPKLGRVSAGLSEYRGSIKSGNEIREIEHALLRIGGDRNALEQRLTNVDRQLGDCQSQCQQLSCIEIPTDCTNRGCSLYASHSRSLRTHQDNMDKINKIKETINDELKAIKNKYASLIEVRDEYMRYKPFMDELKDLLEKFPCIRQATQPTELLTILNSDPSVLYTKTKYLIEISQNTHLHNKVSKELEILENKYTVLMQSKDTSTEMLEEIVKTRREQRDKLRNEHVCLTAKLESHKSYYNKLSLYKTYRKESVEIHNKLKTMTERQMVRYAIDHYENVLKVLKSVRHEYMERLSTVTTTLRDQDRLRSRYHDEVLVSITRLEEELRDFQILEKSTSPNNGIPHQYMLNLINTLVANINYFISLVFNYKFELIPLSQEDSIDYKFSASLNDGEVIVPDISTCSSAQKEMINLAFRLAVMIHLNLQDYPIYLDEYGDTFDEYHIQQLLIFLKDLVDDNTIGQIFLVNHHAIIHDSLKNGEVLVLDDANTTVPAVYNEHVYIQK